MSAEQLELLQACHAFNPKPLLIELGKYHVPFNRLADGSHIEDAVRGACDRYERVGVVGPAGTGKSSVIASVLGSDNAPNLAPIGVAVAAEDPEVLATPRAMLVQIATTLMRDAADAIELSRRQQAQTLAKLTDHRPVGKGNQSFKLSGGWLGATLGGELTSQGAAGFLHRSIEDTREIVQQMLTLIQLNERIPVLVFDDTDRWLRDSTYTDHAERAGRYFGQILPELTELDCSLVVAIHPEYQNHPGVLDGMDRSLERQLKLPRIDSHVGIAAVLQGRLDALDDPTIDLVDVVDAAAINRLYDLYRQGLRDNLRAVLRIAHAALADSIDHGAATITARSIDAALEP